MADKRFLAKAALTASTVLFAFGCGDDVTKTTVNETTGIAQLAAGETFPECASENVGEMLFAADSGAVYYCADGKWQTLDGKDGAVGENGAFCKMESLEDGSGYKLLCGGDSVAVVLNGAKGEDGKLGGNGEFCDVELLSDSTGYKVLCGGDSVGVILNGQKGQIGAQGVPGNDGEDCTLSDDGNGSVKVICATDTATLYKAVCGTEPYDPAKNFCFGNSLIALCGGNSYNLSTHFCGNTGTKDTVVAFCDGATYNLSTHFCANTGTRDTVVAFCDGATYNLSTHFCANTGTKDTVVALCGGDSYNLSTHFCANTGTKDTVFALCGGDSYNLSTHFCANGNTYKTSEYSFVTTEYLNQTMLKNGNYGYLVDSRDKQVYRTIQIGTQTWMAQNLNYGSAQGTNGTNAMYFCPGNFANNCATHGKLYKWSFAKNDACPTGWHLPDTTDFRTLINAAGGETIAGMKLKAETGWFDGEGESSGNGSNDYGFSAIPTGLRDNNGDFRYGGGRAFFLTSTENANDEVYRLILNTEYNSAYLGNGTGKKNEAYSVRCIKD